MDRHSRAFPIATFCKKYGIGRSKAYEEIKSGRLVALKVGRRTLISADDAERWLSSLRRAGPSLMPAQ
jgi:excisionase family DNA binding protein